MSESEQPKAAQTKAQRREEARIKALQLREVTKKREARNRTIAISVLIAAVLVLVGVVGYILSQEEKPSGNVAYQGETAPVLSEVASPSTARADGAITVGATNVAGTASTDPAAVEVMIYSDYECPYCGQFEEINASALVSLQQTGKVTVAYRPIAFLDGASQYSTRSAIAAAVVADAAPDAFSAFNTALFANQAPRGTSTDLKDAKIAEIATAAGVPSDVVDRFTETISPDSTERVFAAWVAANTQAANAEAVANGKKSISTPYLLIDGVEFAGNFQVPGEFESAVLTAVAAKAGS